jgi:hypothetical protein
MSFRFRAVFVTSAVAIAVGAGAGSALAAEATCDGTDPAACLLPYPNDHFTKKVSSTPTKLQLNLPLSGMPKNNSGKPIDQTDINRGDGFSPGSMIETYVPGIDVAKSHINPVTSPGGWADANAGAIVLDTATGQRWPIYGEMDAVADPQSDADLILRPLVNFTEGHTYVVVLRNIVNSSGTPLTSSLVFRQLRDSPRPMGEAMRRVTEYRPIFKAISDAGITKSSVYLAWKFTVASSKSLTGRLISMRNQAFQQLGDTHLADRIVQGRSPTFEIDHARTTDFTVQQNQYLSRRVYGWINVPCFMTGNGCGSGYSLNLNSRGLPVQTSKSNVDRAPFVCNIPRSVADGSTVKEPGFAVLYGHGLVGNYEAITRNSAYAQAGYDYKNVFCGLDWQGMSSGDLGTIGLVVLPDLSHFNTIPDRLQQAHLNFMFLARALIHPHGLGSDPAFQFGGKSVLNGQVGYSGDSQGGILGGATVAVSPDFRYGSLGVPGINYSTLLDRSSDWPEYGQIMYQSYSKGKERPVLMSLIQQLWDRGEGDGYAEHIGKDPLPGSPTNTVLLLPAFGDHQVSNLAAEAYARTIGASLRTPALTTGRSGPFQMFWNINDGGSGNITGNAMLMMDSGPLRGSDCQSLSCIDPLNPCSSNCIGTPPAPVANLAPTIGQDPHGLGGDTAEIRRLVSAYVRTGTLPSGCNGLPCGIGGWTPGP